MSWLDVWERRAREAIIGARTPDAKPAAAVALAAIDPEPPPDIQCVFVQVCRPSANDPGEVREVFYSSYGDKLTLYDCDRKPSGTHELKAGEDPRAVAHRIGRGIWEKDVPDFNRRIEYQPIGIV